MRLAVVIGILLAWCVIGKQVAHAMLEDSLAGKPPFRRLFLDAMVVEESEGLERVFLAAEKYKGNPVIAKTGDWEGWGPYVYGTVMWDEGKLKMWYQAIGSGGDAVCYAESTDGINWTKPNLGILEHNASLENNMVSTSTLFHIPSVMKLDDPPSPEKRWVMYGYGRDTGPHMAYSADGLHWGTPTGEALFASSDVINFFYDPYEKRFGATYKTTSRRHRAAGVAVSDDGLTWKKPTEYPVFTADDLDPDATQIYGMPVFPYQGIYIGLPWIYHARWIKYGRYTEPKVMYEAQEGSPRTVDVQLAWSWDLMNWTRTPKREPFIELGPAGSFDCAGVYTARAPVIVGDKLYFYYGGYSRLHDDEGGNCGAIGLATLRLDGFCSMRAGDNEGWLISRREVFRTPKVTINAKTGPRGYIAAELLDRNNNVIPGFSRDECIPFRGDSIRAVLEWTSKTFPARWKDKDKKIRFYVKDADLYSYLPMAIDTSKDWENRKLH